MHSLGVNDEHVLALVEAVHGANLHAIHQLALDAAFVDDVGQLSVLPAIAVVNSFTVSVLAVLALLAENGRRGDQRPPARSERRTVGI